MKISGIVTQDGSKTVEEISKLQLIAFTHVKPGGYRHSGFQRRALPTGDIVGEYLLQEEAKRAYDKICDKIKQLGTYAFVIVPEDKAAVKLMGLRADVAEFFSSDQKASQGIKQDVKIELGTMEDITMEVPYER